MAPPPQPRRQGPQQHQLPFRGFVLGIALAACVVVLHSIASTKEGFGTASSSAARVQQQSDAGSAAATVHEAATQAAVVVAATVEVEDTPAPTTFAPRPTKPRAPPVTMPWIPHLVPPERQAGLYPALHSFNASTDTASVPGMVKAPDEDGAVAEASDRANALLLRAMDESNAKLTPAMREKLKRTAFEQRRKAEDTLDVLRGVPFSAPTALEHDGAVPAVAVKPPGADGVCYFVLTGNNSHASRVHGLFAVLAESGRRRNRVAWISDVPDARIKPVVLRSSFEDGVCRDGLAEETQMKGCRYQRNFYRALDAIQVVAAAVMPAAAAAGPTTTAAAADDNETSRETVRRDFADCNWFVKLSDDTVVIREHLERLLHDSSGVVVDPTKDRAIIGKVERRNGYQFLSGGHPVVFTRAALRQWGSTDAQNCEGLIIDKAPPKLQKFWWWADDVLTSFCWGYAGAGSSSPSYQLYDLPGAISVTRWALAPIPPALFTRIVPLPRVNTSAHAAAAPAHGREAVLPVSYHTYPYATPRQMFSLWHWLHDPAGVAR